MGYQIKLKPKAEKDIHSILNYYSEISESLGFKFYSELIITIDSLKLFPKFQIKYKNVRCLYINKFPYLIHYKIDEPNLEIHIIAILHMSRDPKLFWKLSKDESL